MFRVGRVAFVVAALFIIALCGSAHADESDKEAAKQANNPLASFTTLNLQNYYIPELSKPDGTANTFLEPQFTILSSGDAGQPQFQVFFGVNIQSMK